ncbi:MAG: acyl carrier protein [Bacteroidota bacterium]
MKEKLLTYVNETLLEGGEENHITSEEDLLTTGILDSVAMMSLVGYIEEEYSLTIPAGELTIENFISIDAITNFLSSKKEEIQL